MLIVPEGYVNLFLILCSKPFPQAPGMTRSLGVIPHPPFSFSGFLSLCFHQLLLLLIAL